LEGILLILLDAFRLHALHDPGSIIMRSDSDEALSYREAWNVSELLGGHLIEARESGELAKGEPVGVFGHRHPLVLSCCFACAKSGHPYQLFNEYSTDIPDGIFQMTLVLYAGDRPFAHELTNLGTRVLDAHRIRSYLVLGMTDDFSCGCGLEDCAHGPFLQECSPAHWLDEKEIFTLRNVSTENKPAQCHKGEKSSTLWRMSAREHDALLAANLEIDQISDENKTTSSLKATSPLPDLADLRIATLIALGKEVGI
jgi:hypothetical protein